MITKENKVTDTNGRIPKIFKNQVVELEKGLYKRIAIDIGHVFAGLDAINHPTVVGSGLSKVFNVKIDKNVDAVTWIGDIGSIMANIIIEVHRRGKNKSLDYDDIQAIINKYAPQQRI